MLKLLTFTLLCASAVAAPHAWKIGAVVDSRMTQNDEIAVENTSSQSQGTVVDAGTIAVGSARSTSQTSVNRIAVRTNEVMIAGDDYLYVVEDSTRRGSALNPFDPDGRLVTALGNRKRGCRVVIGESVRYAQEKAHLYLIDADGKECKLAIVRQERRPPAKPATPPENHLKRPTLRRPDEVDAPAKKNEAPPSQGVIL